MKRSVLLFIISTHFPGNNGNSETLKSLEKKILKPRLFAMQAHYQWMKLHGPNTGKIPAGIRSRELEFVSSLPSYSEDLGQAWVSRGPANIGGRMLCIAVDVDDENHLLAGSASGGIWKSLNRGLNWQKTTSLDAEQSATCLVQDKCTGKHGIWYYGTGELLSTIDRNISTNARSIGIGNGIYKSTDYGSSWQPLASTQGGMTADLNEIFQGVWRIVTDPIICDKDIVYAACYGAIMRSEDGGSNWDVALAGTSSGLYSTVPFSIEILLVDASGKPAGQLSDRMYPAGKHTVKLNPCPHPACVYYLVFRSNRTTEVRKFVIL